MSKTVAIIFGGEGCECKISQLSAKNLLSLIDRNLYSVIPVGITEKGFWYIYRGDEDKIADGTWVDDTKRKKPTYPVRISGKSGLLSGSEIIPVFCAIPCLHGDFGEDGIIQGALVSAHIKYVGQDIYGSAITSDKVYSKMCAEHLSIPTARWALLTDAATAKEYAERKIGYPMFLKPTRLGSSFGAHPVLSPDAFESAFADAYKYESRVLAESLLPTKYEIECAFLENEGIILSPYGRIDFGGEFYDFESKYRPGSKAEARITVPLSDATVEEKVREYSEKLVKFLGLRHLSRIDFLVTETGEVFFNEINSFPGMTKSSLYPALTESAGLKRGEFINLLIEKASL